MAKSPTDWLTDMVNDRRIEEVEEIFDPRETALLSIAVSMKRIADIMRGDVGYPDIRCTLETIADRMGPYSS